MKKRLIIGGALNDTLHLGSQSVFSVRGAGRYMTEPVCSNCAVDFVCANHKELFRPVLCTSFY